MNKTKVSQIRIGYRKTTDPKLAIEAARGTDKLPIEFISPRVREAYCKAYPKLLKKVS